MIYVLLLITQVYGGNMVHTQEFSSLATCENAKATITANAPVPFFNSIYAKCVEK